MEPTTAHPIIIVKKKAAHGGHHGGAWKVAYADFVTAMMALFIVLWLLNSSQEIQKVVGGYFVDPSGKGKDIGTGAHGAGNTVVLKKDDMSKLKESIEKALQKKAEFNALKSQIQIIVTSEGLRIELLENEVGTFFESGRAQPTQKCRELLSMLSLQLGMLPNRILIEGHTDSKPFAVSGAYTNWELSADRANAARRLMEEDGLKKGQVAQVRGFADQNLRLANDPENASNRRVSVIVQYQSGATPVPPKKDGPAAENPGVPGEHPSAATSAASGEKPPAAAPAASAEKPSPMAPAASAQKPPAVAPAPAGSAPPQPQPASHSK